MSQKNFTFKKYRIDYHGLNDIPTTAFTFEDEMISRMNRAGYLVKNLRRKLAIIGDVARANVPYKERLKMQKEISQMPDTKVLKLLKHYQ